MIKGTLADIVGGSKKSVSAKLMNEIKENYGILKNMISFSFYPHINDHSGGSRKHFSMWTAYPQLPNRIEKPWPGGSRKITLRVSVVQKKIKGFGIKPISCLIWKVFFNLLESQFPHL